MLGFPNRLPAICHLLSAVCFALRRSTRRYLAVTICYLLSAICYALPPDDARKIYDRAAPSLVVVRYTMESEFGRRDIYGQGVVIREEGLVLASMALFPLSVPDEQMKDFKIIVPGDDEKELAADFLGRDDRYELAFLKTTEPQKWAAVRFEDIEARVADPVISVGLLPKDSGYKPYLCEAQVSAHIRGPTPYVLVNANGLATIGSPVYNAEGKAIGLVPYLTHLNPLLNKTQTGLSGLAPPSRFYVPARDFLSAVNDPPSGGPIAVPWMGASLSGLNKEVAEYYDLKNVPVGQVGEVIPLSPAEKAGLKAGDKIVKYNGQALERGDEPEETPMILQRRIRRLKVGDTVALSVLREKGKPPVEVKMALEQQPRQAHQVKRYYADDLGMSMREVVFADTYAKRVSPQTQGVVVAYVRPSSSAATAGLRLGDLVTHINKQPIENLESFKNQYQDFRKASPKELVVLVVIRELRTEVIKIEPPQ